MYTLTLTRTHTHTRARAAVQELSDRPAGTGQAGDSLALGTLQGRLGKAPGESDWS